MLNTLNQLLRTKNCLMASIATSIGFFVAKNVVSIDLFLLMLATFLICGAGQTINDVFDYNIDKKISKSKPLPSKKISLNQAKILAMLLFLVGNAIAVFVGTTAFLISIIFSILLVIYSGFLFKHKFVGNMIVALSTGIPFVFGASVNSIPLIIWFFLIIAFFSNLAREVTKDFEDLKKDKGFKKTLPMTSKKLSRQLIIFCYSASILLAFAIGVLFSLNILYFVFIIISVIVFSKTIFLLNKKNYKQSQACSKKGMLVSLIAFITTIFF